MMKMNEENKQKLLEESKIENIVGTEITYDTLFEGTRSWLCRDPPIEVLKKVAPFTPVAYLEFRGWAMFHPFDDLPRLDFSYREPNGKITKVYERKFLWDMKREVKIYERKLKRTKRLLGIEYLIKEKMCGEMKPYSRPLTKEELKMRFGSYLYRENMNIPPNLESKYCLEEKMSAKEFDFCLKIAEKIFGSKNPKKSLIEYFNIYADKRKEMEAIRPIKDRPSTRYAFTGYYPGELDGCY